MRTLLSEQAAAVRRIARIMHCWRQWNDSQLEAGQHMFKRQVDPITGRTPLSPPTRYSRYC